MTGRKSSRVNPRSRWMLILFFLMVTEYGAAQLSLSPKRVVLHEYTRSGELKISNGSDTAQEVMLDLSFGYPSFKENGELMFVFDDTVRAQDASLDSHLMVFPRQFLLEPGASQVVRLFLQPSFEREEGTYWTRLLVKGGQRSRTVGTNDGRESVGTALMFQIDQSVSVYYQQGNPDVTLSLTHLMLDTQGDRPVLRTQFSRQGNSPFLGRYSVSIRAPNDREWVSQSGSFYCHFTDWLITELPEIQKNTQKLRVRYRFTPFVFEQRSGQLRPVEPFELEREIDIPGRTK